MFTLRVTILPAILALTVLGPAMAQAPPGDTPDGSEAVYHVLQLLSNERREATLELLRENWRPEFTPMILEIMRVSRDGVWNAKLTQLLQQKTRRGFTEYELWWEWLLRQEPRTHPTYPQFKSALHGLVDPAFQDYFVLGHPARVRLDGVRWAGVRHDSIPALHDPATLGAAEAGWLGGDDAVYGVVVGGEARAWPRRVVIWHEVVHDTVDGTPIVLVLSPLAGAVNVYRAAPSPRGHRPLGGTEGETVLRFAPSGFLFDSIQLMRDEATGTLWHPLRGEPVVGPLAGEDVALERLSVTATTWSDWRRRHPETRVLSSATGHQRDYSPGAAYSDYLDDDKLLFSASAYDKRLAKKEPMVGIVDDAQALAVSRRFLRRNPIVHDELTGRRFVALTDAAGVSRIYAARDVTFTEWDGGGTVVDAGGGRWSVADDELRRADGRTLARWPAQYAYWFAWYATFQDTRLIDTYSRD